jgi:radical SAM protein with 4Fe4S-binding SPASM domain
LGINDGKGIVFVSRLGEIFPSGFLPICCGQFPNDHLVRVYQQSPLFRWLRDAKSLQGKCGACEYRHVCGGSRARALAVTGDPFAEDPDCAYVPQALQQGS